MKKREKAHYCSCSALLAPPALSRLTKAHVEVGNELGRLCLVRTPHRFEDLRFVVRHGRPKATQHARGGAGIRYASTAKRAAK